VLIFGGAATGGPPKERYRGVVKGPKHKKKGGTSQRRVSVEKTHQRKEKVSPQNA